MERWRRVHDPADNVTVGRAAQRKTRLMVITRIAGNTQQHESVG
jgi:hypothetical protein